MSFGFIARVLKDLEPDFMSRSVCPVIVRLPVESRWASSFNHQRSTIIHSRVYYSKNNVNFPLQTEKPSAPLKGSEAPAYGAIVPQRPIGFEQHVPNNPFVSGAYYQTEQVQPPTDPHQNLTDDGTY